MPLSRRSSQLLARVNFPPYTVQGLTDRHFLVAGGGGGAKTGIPNVIEIYELINNGSSCRAQSVMHFETGTQAIMNCAVFNSSKYFILFAGMEGTCQMYKLKLGLPETKKNGIIKEIGNSNHSTLRSRNVKASNEMNGNCHAPGEAKTESPSNPESVDLVFNVKPLDSFQTDFSDDPFQKLVRFSKDVKFLATAGADGYIRVWKYPETRQVHEIHAHEDDVDDIDFSPLGDKIVSVSRDGHGKVWSSKDGSLVRGLEYELPLKSQLKYTFRNCRFTSIEGDKTNPALFITFNPAVRVKPPSPSFLSKWDGKDFFMQKAVSTGTEMLSTMAVSDDGKFIGLGTQEGSVEIYIAFSLQRLYRADHVHSIFVTGLEFLQSADTTRHITGDKEASLISISVDNHINVHHIHNRATIGFLSIIILFALMLFSAFLLMDFLNL